MNTGSWLLCRGAAEYRLPLFFDSRKHPFEDVFQYRYSWEFRNIHKKTPVLGSLFNKVASLQICNFLKKRRQHRCFPVNIAKFLRTPFLQNTSGVCFWTGKGKRLEHTLEYTYHRQISRQIFLAFLPTFPRDGYALPNLTEAQQLRNLCSRPV